MGIFSRVSFVRRQNGMFKHLMKEMKKKCPREANMTMRVQKLYK